MTDFKIPPAVPTQNLNPTLVFTGLTAATASVDTHIHKKEKEVTLQFLDAITVTATGGTPVLTSGQLPLSVRPESTVTFDATVLDNGAAELGYIQINGSGIITINSYTMFSGTGTSGLSLTGRTYVYRAVN